MGVIPIIKDSTVVEDSVAFSIDGKALLIQNFDQSQFENQHDSNACYDLRVGDKYRDHRNSEAITLKKDDVIILDPGSAVIIKTREYVHFPKCMFGNIIPKVGLLQKGISNTFSKIDPGYKGHLLITVFNLGKQVVFLKFEEKFCSLNVLRVEVEGLRPYDKEPKDFAGKGKISYWEKFSDFVKKHDALVKLIILSLQIGYTVFWIIKKVYE